MKVSALERSRGNFSTNRTRCSALVLQQPRSKKNQLRKLSEPVCCITRVIRHFRAEDGSIVKRCDRCCDRCRRSNEYIVAELNLEIQFNPMC